MLDDIAQKIGPAPSHPFRVQSEPGQTSGRLRYEFPNPQAPPACLRITFSLNGWSTVDVVSYGWISEDGQFTSLRAKNPPLNQSLQEIIDPQSLVFRLQNGAASTSGDRIVAIQIDVRGKSSAHGSSIELSAVEAGTPAPSENLRLVFGGAERSLEEVLSPWNAEPFERVPEGVLQLLRTHEMKTHPDFSRKAEQNSKNSSLALTNHPTIPWELNQTKPSALEGFATALFRWHSWDVVTLQLLAYEQRQEVCYLFAAREFAAQWLEVHYFNANFDEKYAWYDHAVAMRLIAMLRLWAHGLELNFDARFSGRLLLAIHDHCALLATEAFYACGQPMRHHNHAVFQDIALYLAPSFIPHFSEGRMWQQKAVARVIDQFEGLTVLDGRYRSNIENTFSYHIGMMSLLKLVHDLLRESGQPNSELGVMLEQMDNFKEEMMYLDRRAPAYGDTSRIPNKAMYVQKSQSRSFGTSRVFHFPNAGIAGIKDCCNGVNRQLTMVATNQSLIHKHADHLSFSYWADGVEWIVDPGLYSYSKEDLIAQFSRGPAGHNGLCVPDHDYVLQEASAQLQAQGYEPEGAYSIRGSHTCYRSFRIERIINGQLGTGLLTIRDQLVPTGEASIMTPSQILLQFSDGVGIHWLQDHCFELHSPLCSSRLRISLPESANTTELNGTADQSLVGGWNFFEFARKSAAHAVLVRFPGAASIEWTIDLLKSSSEHPAKSPTPSTKENE